MSKKSPQILTPNELQTLKDERKEIESTLHSLESGDRVGAGTAAEQIDRGKLRAEAARLEKMIQDGTPGRVSGVQKDRLAAEAKALAEKIQEGMCTKDEMMRPEKNSGAIRKHFEWEQRNAADIQRFKQIQRQLGESSSIEQLRRG